MSDHSLQAIAPFPSPPLIVLSVISCFIATAAFISSFTQVDTHFAYFIVPSSIGFLATIPYHVHLYLTAQEHHKSPSHSDPIFITPTWIIIGFILIPLWAVIFYINILFCVGEGTAGIILTTIWSGFEWIVLLCIALRGIHELKHVKSSGASLAESQSVGSSGSNEIPLKLDATGNKPRFIYFISFVLCTLTLIFGIDISFVCLINVITFFLTAPHHIAIYISYVRPQSPNSTLSHPTSVPWAFFLAALWCGVFVLDILVSRFAYQVILLGIFTGVECIIIAYLAVRSVLDSFAEGRIKL